MSQPFDLRAARATMERAAASLRPSLLPSGPTPSDIAVTANYASEFYRRLKSWIEDFDKSLDQTHEVGIGLVSFGRVMEFRLEDLGYWNPSLISFSGHNDDGNPVELIQHVSQISVLLTGVLRKNLDGPKTPIGFHAIGMETDEPLVS